MLLSHMQKTSNHSVRTAWLDEAKMPELQLHCPGLALSGCGTRIAVMHDPCSHTERLVRAAHGRWAGSAGACHRKHRAAGLSHHAEVRQAQLIC